MPNCYDATTNGYGSDDYDARHRYQQLLRRAVFLLPAATAPWAVPVVILLAAVLAFTPLRAVPVVIVILPRALQEYLLLAGSRVSNLWPPGIVILQWVVPGSGPLAGIALLGACPWLVPIVPLWELTVSSLGAIPVVMLLARISVSYLAAVPVFRGHESPNVG